MSHAEGGLSVLRNHDAATRPSHLNRFLMGHLSPARGERSIRAANWVKGRQRRPHPALRATFCPGRREGILAAHPSNPRRHRHNPPRFLEMQQLGHASIDLDHALAGVFR